MQQGPFIKTVIIDDEESAYLLMEEMLSKIDGVVVSGHASDVSSGINLILKYRPDIIFLDIRLGHEKGFDLITALKDYDIEPFIIMVTGYDQFALEAIKAGAFDYLLKPVDPDELLKVISRFRQKQSKILQQPSIRKLRFSVLSGFILVDPAEIIYCKADANYTDLVLTGQRRHTISQNIGKIGEILTGPEFFRISRSVIINLKYLVEINRGKHLCTLSANQVSYQLSIARDRIKDLEGAFVQ